MSSQSSFPKLIIIILLIGAAAGAYYFFSNEDSKEPEAPPQVQRLRKQPIEKPVLNPNSPYTADGELKDKGLAPKKKIITTKTPPVKTDFQKAKERQEKIKNEFKSKLKAEFDMPENLEYTEMDLEEGVAGIFGVGRGDLKSYTALGTNRKINDDIVTDYLNDSGNALPFGGKVKFRKKPIKQMTAPGHTGIGRVKVFESNNPGTKAALLERRDGKGSYMIIMEANSGYFNNNEGYLEKMLDNFKAKAP
jgi:hypothetical protein